MKSLTILACLLLPALGIAQGISTGEANLKFLFPARVLSMAGAPIADTQSASMSFVNPACLAYGKSFQIAFSQMQWIQDIQSQILSVSTPMTVGTASFALSNTSVANIPVRDVPGPAIGSFDAHSTVFQLGYALNVIPEVSVGATVKYLYDKLYVDDASGYGLDIGALYCAPIDGLSFAAAVTNFGRISAFRSQKTDLPTKVDLGAEYAFSSGDFAFVSAMAFGHETATDGAKEFRVGGEVTYSELVSARIGYQTGYDIRNLSAGLGIHYSFLQFDYAYIPFTQGFGNANIITVGVKL